MWKITLLVAIFFLLYGDSPILAVDVVINEFQVEPSNTQWVELYNKGQQAVDISGWVIDDDGGTQKYIIGNNISLPSQKCLSFQSGNFNFDIASSDSARLIVNNETVDNYSYSVSPGENISFGRSVDGGDTWITFNNPSRDKLNSTGEVCLVPTPTPTPTLTPVPTSVPTSSPTNTGVPAATPTTKPLPTPTLFISSTIKKVSPTINLIISPTDYPTEVETTGTVLGESVESTSVGKGKGKELPIFFLLLGSGIMFLAAAVVLGVKAKRNN